MIGCHADSTGADSWLSLAASGFFTTS